MAVDIQTPAHIMAGWRCMIRYRCTLIWFLNSADLFIKFQAADFTAEGSLSFLPDWKPILDYPDQQLAQLSPGGYEELYVNVLAMSEASGADEFADITLE
jgi:hypothetical protein